MKYCWIRFRYLHTVKRATCVQTLLENNLKSDVVRFTFKPVLQHVAASCVNAYFSLDKIRGTNAIHGGDVTFCKTSLPWAGKIHNMYRFYSKK